MPQVQIIVGRQGNQKMPIPANDFTISRQHCKITQNPDKSFTIENLSANGTRINGVPYVRKIVNDSNTQIQIGEKFTATVAQLLGIKPELVFHVSHLSDVWVSYQQALAEVRARQKKVNLVRTGCGMFTMLTVPLAMVIGPAAYILTGVGFIGNLYSFFGMKNDNTPEVMENIKDQFMDLYVCPNKECGHTLPMMSYKQLRKNYKSCPHCKAKYID